MKKIAFIYVRAYTNTHMAKSWQAEKVDAYRKIINIVAKSEGKKISQADLIAEIEVSVGYSIDSIEKMLFNLYSTERLFLNKAGEVTLCKQ